MFDVWETKNGNEISIDGNGSRKVNVAIYCRVSTEHEAQIKALDNQIEWFNDILPHHPNWQLVSSCFSAQSARKRDNHKLQEYEGYYIDEGLSGLSTVNRPALNQLLNDAKSGRIDLILTREVCRFSRNIVDAISITRDLKAREYGVAINYYNDGIFTYSPDAELKLGIYATFAQSESQKVSERVRAGQKSSRNKNTLYGNGNILGYNLIKADTGSNYFEINEEQAETVRRIYQLCIDGFGVTKIGNTLTTERRKNSSGEVKWSYQNILRVLQNKTYCGYVAYNHTVSDDCMAKKRHNVNKSERQYKKVSNDIVPVIINEELWNECQRQLKKRTIEYFHSTKENGKSTAATDVFAKKLRCKCGHSFRRDIWHKNKNSSNTYGYTCYNVLNHGKASNYSNADEIEKLNICEMPAISSVKLCIQAVKVFEGLISDRSIIDDAIKKATKKSVNSVSSLKKQIITKEAEIEKIKKRNKKYLDLLADEIITKDEFFNHKSENENQIARLQKDIHDLQVEIGNENKPEVDSAKLFETLNQLLDCSNDVDERIIDKFVYRIIVDSPTHFIWQIHFKPITTENPQFVDLASHHIDCNFAKNYSKQHHKKCHSTRWVDIDVDVQIAI